jgi:hypothetical protein
MSARREHRFLVRMPESVFSHLRQETKRHSHSVNQQIIRRITIGRADRMEIATLDVAIEGIDSVISTLAEQRRSLQAERLRLRRRVRRSRTRDAARRSGRYDSHAELHNAELSANDGWCNGRSSVVDVAARIKRGTSGSLARENSFLTHSSSRARNRSAYQPDANRWRRPNCGC